MADSKAKIPKVRIARPKGRPFQLRYICPNTGRKIRISCGTRDEAEAERMRCEAQAKLTLGIPAEPKKRTAAGRYMPWEEFRERYSDLQLSTLRDRTSRDAESRLDIATRILNPRTLDDMANAEALHDLQSRLLAGEESPKHRKGRPRSPHTVKSSMAAIIAALNWAVYMEWLSSVPRLRKVKTAKLKAMKGRPIALEEFERLLHVVPKVVGDDAAPSWRYVLQGLLESGLRLGELLDMSWDDQACIMPVWRRGALPVLAIPHDKQKNAVEESIPLLPGFETLLHETLEMERSGFVFNPVSLQIRLGRKIRHGRLSAEHVGKVISRIGERAGVIVEPAKSDNPAKHASAHDLRRSCAERLLDSGVPEREVARVLRHASVETTRRHYAPGNVQKSAGVIREKLGQDEGHNYLPVRDTVSREPVLDAVG